MLILKIIVLFEIVVITETGSAFAKKSNRDVYKDCGIHSAANGLVLGGKYVARGLWPWNVALFDIHPREYFCGGVLLSRRFVITAAHCLHAKHSIKRDHANILLVFGAYNLDFVKEPGTVSSYLNRSYIHPDWNTRTDNYDADIALIEVKNTITYSNFIKPVCLWTGDNLLDEVKGTVIGWGATSITKEASNEPFEITVPFVSYKNCLSDYPELGDVSSPRTFCGGARDGIQGPCYGDSGSGMFVKNKKRYYLRGLVSVSLSDNNKTCDTSVYALYTNIFMFTEWIRQTTEMTRTVPSNCSIDANYGYSCKVSAHIKRKSDKLNFSGAHMEGKTDNDVVYLKLDDSTINIIPTNIFEKFNNLTSLKMWNVGLTQINELSFTSCPNLIALGLQQNFLTKLPSRAFKELKQLIGLGVNSNPITEIETDAFEGLGNLKYLFMCDTEISKIDETTFEPLVELEMMHLNKTKIKTIHSDAFKSLTKLWYLNLTDGELTNIEPNLFKPLISLKYLLLNNNLIEDLDKDLFQSLTKLKVLSLKNNNIQKLSSSMFLSQSKLEQLSFKGNKISIIENGTLVKMTSLLRLDLSENKCVDELFQYIIDYDRIEINCQIIT